MTNSPSTPRRRKSWLYTGAISVGLGLGLWGNQLLPAHAATTNGTEDNDIVTTETTEQSHEVTLKTTPDGVPPTDKAEEVAVPALTEPAAVPTEPTENMDEAEIESDENVSADKAGTTPTVDPVLTETDVDVEREAEQLATPAPAKSVRATTAVPVTTKATPQVKADIDLWMPNETLQDLVWRHLKADHKDKSWASAKDITKEDMLLLTELSAQRFLVSLYIDGKTEFSLEGLQYATNLEKLDLYNSLNVPNNAMRGDIVDITPLSALEKLTFLQLVGNWISDVTPIANLKNVTYLAIGTNCIADFSALDAAQYTQSLNIDGQVVDMPLVYVNKKTRTYSLTNPMKAPKGMTLSLGTVGSVTGIPIFPVGTSDPLARIYYNGAATQKLVGDQLVYTGIVDQVTPGVTTSPFPGYGAYPSDYVYYLTSTYVTAGGTRTINVFTPYVLADEAEPVTVNYVDDKGKVLKDPVKLTGMVGEPYKAPVESFDGYRLVKTPANATGEFGDTAVTVTFVYEKEGEVTPPVDPQPDTTVTITVQFQTANGVKVAADKILTGKPGQTYTTSPAEVDNQKYVLVTTPANASGTFGDQDTTITYVYAEVTNEGDGDQATTDPDVVAPDDDEATDDQLGGNAAGTNFGGQADQILTSQPSDWQPAPQATAAKSQHQPTLPQTDERTVSPIWGLAALLGLGLVGIIRRRLFK